MFCTRLKKIKFLRPLLLAFLFGALSACGGGGIEVTTFLANNSKVEKGAAVYFDNAQVGQVSDVVEEAAGTRIAMNLDDDAAAKISRQSAVVMNTLKQGSPLEIYNPTIESGEFLLGGQEIKGLDSMFQLGAWMVGDAFKSGSGSVNQYVEAFQDYLKGDQFQKDKTTVKVQIDDAKDTASDAIVSIEQDLNQAVEEITMSEKEIATAMTELGNGLSPIVQELSKTTVELMQELEKFALSLENTTPERQQSGEKFMQSLEETLEELNLAIEQGVEQAQNE